MRFARRISRMTTRPTSSVPHGERSPTRLSVQPHVLHTWRRRLRPWGAMLVLAFSLTGCLCRNSAWAMGGDCDREPIIERAPPSDLPGGPKARGRPPGPPAFDDSSEVAVAIPVSLPTVTVPDSLFVDLRAALDVVARAQERFHADHGLYTPDLLRLIPVDDDSIATGVVLKIESADSAGWSASATHPAVRRRSCVISFTRGNRAPRINTLRERRPGHAAPGVVMCDGA